MDLFKPRMTHSAKTSKKPEFIRELDKIKEYRLPNGLKVLLKQDLNAPMFAWQVWYKVGSRNEQDTLTGIAHYLEHMMFKGTDTFAKGEISQSIQLKGGVFNAFTGDDYTAYFENFSPENLELAIRLEADRMRNSKLAQEELELERSVIISELEGGENSPQTHLYKSLKSNAFHVHPYKNPIIGWQGDLYNIDHKSMKDFYDTYYHPGNAVAVLVGNFDTDLALDLIGKYFGDYSQAEKQFPKVAVEPKQTETRRSVVYKEGSSKLLALAFKVPEFNHEDTHALQLLADSIFSGESSRMHRLLVDSNLATNISGYSEASIDPALFRIIVALNPDTDIERVEKVVLDELEKVKTELKQEELDLAKARAEASTIYERDGVYDEALQIGYFEALSGDWTKYVSWVDDLKAVELPKVKEVAVKYLVPTALTITKLLPKESEPKTLAELNVDKKFEQNYGAGKVEALNPEKLQALLEKLEPKYTKGLEPPKLDLGLKKISFEQGTSLQTAQVLLKQDKNLPLVYSNIVFFGGSANSNLEAKPGLAYVTAEMLEKGSEKKNKFEIAELLDKYGAAIEFTSGVETAAVEISTLSKYKTEVFALLHEILFSPAFSEKELEKLKEKIIAKLKLEDDSAAKIARRELARVIFPEDHPYFQYSVEDRIKSITSIDISDVKAFYKKYYNPAQLYVSIVGDIDEAESRKFLEMSFAGLHAQDMKDFKPEFVSVESKEPKSKTFVKEGNKQSEILMGHAIDLNRSSKDFYALLVANFALGGSPLSSRLGNVVRDQHGYVYNIRSGFNAGLGAKPFIVSLGCNPKNADHAIELTKELIAEFIKDGITETELTATKSYLTGSFAARNLSSNSDIADAVAQMQVYGLEASYISEYASIINSLTVEEVNAAAKKYLKPGLLNTIIVGPNS